MRQALPSRKSVTEPTGDSTQTPLPRPRPSSFPSARTRSPRSRTSSWRTRNSCHVSRSSPNRSSRAAALARIRRQLRKVWCCGTPQTSVWGAGDPRSRSVPRRPRGDQRIADQSPLPVRPECEHVGERRSSCWIRRPASAWGARRGRPQTTACAEQSSTLRSVPEARAPGRCSRPGRWLLQS